MWLHAKNGEADWGPTSNTGEVFLQHPALFGWLKTHGCFSLTQTQQTQRALSLLQGQQRAAILLLLLLLLLLFFSSSSSSSSIVNIILLLLLLILLLFLVFIIIIIISF